MSTTRTTRRVLHRTESMPAALHRLASDCATLHVPVTWSRLARGLIAQGWRQQGRCSNAASLAAVMRGAFIDQIQASKEKLTPDWAAISQAVQSAGWVLESGRVKA